tara:strand:- start:85 stop:687 length:603 start_codon:yes stop_codon:yes gene_type:complete
MLLTCENCKTIFRVDEKVIAPQGQQVRCSVCKHVWMAEQKSSGTKPNSGLLLETVARLRYPALLIAALMLVSVGLFSFRGPLTAQFPGLISSFNLAGLTIVPDPSVLEVRDLKADYYGKLLRVRGVVFNTGDFRAHASMLSLRVMDEDGAELHQQIFKPDNYFIDRGQAIPFFVQLEVVGAKKAHITVEAVAERLPPRMF